MANVDPFAKVTVGDPFRFKAMVHNALIDLINERRIPGMGGGSRIPGHPENETAILVKNATGQDIPQFGVVAITTPSILQSANDQAFRSRHWWNGDTPTSSSIVAITQEPIAKGNTGTETDGRIGPAIMLGQTPAKVNVTDSSHTFCVPSTSTSTLDSAATGPIKLLWYDTSGGSTGNDKWAKVLLLNSSAGGAAASQTHYYAIGAGSNATVASTSWVNSVGPLTEVLGWSLSVNPGSHFSIVSNRIRVATAGKYLINMIAGYAMSTVLIYHVGLALGLNGVADKVVQQAWVDWTNWFGAPGSSQSQILSGSIVKTLAANDDLSAFVGHENDAANSAFVGVDMHIFSLDHF